VVLINGEVLANGTGSKIVDQRLNANILAEGLKPILVSDMKVAVMHGNKPQVGFVLFRSELASHILHTVPLDVCGADTQGATGYMLSQAFMNVISRAKNPRKVMCMLTQALVDSSKMDAETQMKAIGPWFDREKAELYRQARGWMIAEEPGRGYRRAVPTLPPVEILEFEGIRCLLDLGNVVIAGGGGGVPVTRNARGDLEGIEVVVETDQLACMMALKLKAKTLLMVVERDDKFLLSGLSAEGSVHWSLAQLDEFILNKVPYINSKSVQSKLRAASDFLHKGGAQVVVTTLRKLPDAIANQNGLWFGSEEPFMLKASP
jgi:carbamate kinase